MNEIVENEENKVQITLRTIGPSPPTRLNLPSSIKVRIFFFSGFVNVVCVYMIVVALSNLGFFDTYLSSI